MPKEKKPATSVGELLEIHSYQQGEQPLAVVAGEGSLVISSIYRRPDMTIETGQTWIKFPGENLFTLKMNFTHLGD